MITLPSDFEISRYGLHCRLVNEDDAAFILKLRLDDRRSRFIHSTDPDLEMQVRWIREYKRREAIGLEYYFIYDIDGVPFGVNRIYDVKNDHCTEGSWVCMPIADSSKAIASALIIRDIIFDFLGFDYDLFDVRVGNGKVKKFHLISGADIVEQNETEYYFRLQKEVYLQRREWFIQTYNLKTGSVA